MKKQVFLLAMLLILSVKYSAFVILAQTNQYVDLSQSVLNPASKAGWTLVFADEFNGNRSYIWRTQFCWGNVAPSCPYYNRASNIIQTTTSIKFATTKDNPILAPPSSYYVTKKYSSAELVSGPCHWPTNIDTLPQDGGLWKYGYFEARIKNPKAQQTWPAFWLFGEPNYKSAYNEIDCYEVGTGDELVLTNHYQPYGGEHHTMAKWIYALPGQTFGNTWVTYGMKWEPNKIIWYINNVPVRIETDRSPSTTNIPSSAMRVLLGSGLSEWYSQSNSYLPKVFPNNMEVDYIRVYQRNNYSVADPIFTINKLTGNTPQTPVNVPFSAGLPIFLDASESYMPNHAYFLSVQRCDANGNLFTPEAMDWLSSSEVDNINKLDLKTFASQHGLNMAQGNYYRIKLVGEPWTENDQYLYTTSCTNSVNFKVNGQNTTAWPTAISIPYNNGKPRIITDVSSTRSCDNSYYISVAQCDASGNIVAGTEKTKWLTEDEKNYLNYFDIEYFCSQNGLTLTEGNYYKIKWAVVNIYTLKAQVIYISPCSNSISFDINGQTNAFPTAINISNGSDILLDGSSSRFCSNIYFLSVQECNSNGGVFGTEVSQWFPFFGYDSQNKIYYYDIGRIDIRDFCRIKYFDLGCNKYYRIKLATGNPWIELSKVIFIQSCPNVNNSFEVYSNFNSSKHCYVANECIYSDADAISLYAPNSISCNQSYYISVQKRVNGILTGTEAMSWLSNLDIYNLKSLGNFLLKDFAKDPNHDGVLTDGIVLCDQNDPTFPNFSYRIKMVSGAGSCNSYTWVENNKIIYFGGGSGKILINDTANYTQIEDYDGMQIYPNPATNYLLIKSSNEKEFKELKIIDLTGKEIKVFQSISKQDIVDLNDIPNGIYLIRGIFDDNSVVTKKLQVIK